MGKKEENKFARDQPVKKNAKGTAAIILKKNLIDEGNGYSTLKVKNYGETHNLCELEPFRQQPVTAGWVCKGFLVKKDVIGYPMGLPVKYAPGAKVRGFEDAFFIADLDTYMGNSGSPVFNADTHEVIGLVAHGDTRDFRDTGKGWASVIYPTRDIKSSKPKCTRASQFLAYC